MREDRSINHFDTRRRYSNGVKEEREKEMSRGDRVELARLRAGHHPDLRKWRKMVGLDQTDHCRLCGEEKTEDSEHLWLKCPALERLRREQRMGRDYGELFERPTQAMAMLRLILSRLR